MKKLLPLLIAPLLFIYTASAEPVNCVYIPEHNKYICDNATPTPTVTPVPTVTPTATATASATPTPVLPTATPTIAPTAVSTRPLPARSPDGTYYITQTGIYSGTATCGNIGAGAHCVHIWNSNGVVLQDFSITTAQGYGLQFDNKVTIKRGTITAPLGASGHHKINTTFDTVVFDVSTVALQYIGSGCEASNPRPNLNATVRNSTFLNDSGHELLYMKCAQDVTIEGNQFKPNSDWAVSLPDGVNVTIRRNAFDLTSEPGNWLGIELPKVANALVTENSAIGPAGDWLVWTCCGTTGLSVHSNTVGGGMGTLCCILPPTTGTAGLQNHIYSAYE